MNPLFFADWARIHRLFRGVMWMVVCVMVLVLFFAVSTHAAPQHAHLDLRDSAQATGVSR